MLARPAPPSSLPRIGHLPGLDGLRALAVVAVVAFHLDLGWATGGFLGVEVFFVVSGYLITRLLLEELAAAGTVDRPRFWTRRARRLLPAVVAAVVAALAWSTIAGTTGELGRFRGDALASLVYVQNWHAVVIDEPYFLAFDRPSPFRHLWSLAIEEQFYLLWPLLLPPLVRRGGRRLAGALVLAGAGASVIAMASLADVAAPERAYYGTDTRAFGILVGGALAFAWRPERFLPSIGAAARRTLDWGGAAALGLLVWQLGRRSELDPWTYPWGFLVVDACTLAVIVAATHPGSRMRYRVGSPLLCAVGRRSYSLYLWHWPVLVFTRPGVDWELRGAPALAVRLVLVGVLSELSFRLVEQPFRDGRAQAWLWSLADRANARRLLGVVVAGSAAPVVLVIALVATAPAPRADVVAASTPVTIDLAAPPATTAAPPMTTTTLAESTVAPSTAPVATGTPVTQPPRPTPPPPTTAAPPPAPVPDVTVVGESVTLGAAGALQDALGPRVQIDAAESRSFEQGIEVVELLTLAGRLTPTVVVHLGTNGIVPDGGLERISTAIGPERRLVLTTVRVDRPWEGQVNDTVRAFAAGCDRCTLVDWHAVARAEPGLTVDDGVHLSPAGVRRYTELLVGAV